MDVIREDFPDILQAFLLTLKLAVFSGIGSLVLGTILASFRVSPVPILRFVGTSFVNIFRNTPLTLVMVFSLFGLTYALGISFDEDNINNNAFRMAVLALTVYTSTFVCEVLRAGINTVHLGQAEAARAIGLTFTQNLRYVILPQAFRAVIAPLGSVFIALTKNTTVAYAIGVVTQEGINEAGGHMRVMLEFNADIRFLIFALFALGFMCMTLPLGLLSGWAARRWSVAR